MKMVTIPMTLLPATRLTHFVAMMDAIDACQRKIVPRFKIIESKCKFMFCIVPSIKEKKLNDKLMMKSK